MFVHMWGSEEGVRCPGAGIRGHCEPPGVGARKSTGRLGKQPGLSAAQPSDQPLTGFLSLCL